MADHTKSFTTNDIVTDTSIELPMIVEVNDKCKEYSLQKGDLLWLTQLVEEDETNATTTVEGSRWDAPDFTISFKMDAKITFSQKTYSVVKENISFGPVMDVSGLANIAEPNEPVFGITAACEQSEGILKLAEGAGRIVNHGKEHITGFLAKGVNNPLMIPGDYKGLFSKSQSLATKSVNKPAHLQDLLTHMPVEVVYSGGSTKKDRPGLKSPDEVTLLAESPITILALCRYTATYFSLHDDSSSYPPFHAAWFYPDYCRLAVRPASPIPLHPWSIDNLPKPPQTVQVLTTEQFEEMNDRLKQSPPPPPAHATPTRLSTASSIPESDPIYEVAPPDARRLAGAVSSGGKVFDVPARRSVKRNKRIDKGRRTKSDLGLTRISDKEYINIGVLGPAKGTRSDGYMRMNAGLPSNDAPVLPPRPQLSSTTDDKTRRPIPKPRSNDQNRASTLPSRRLTRHATDPQIGQFDNDDLDYGQEYALIPVAPGNKDSNGNRLKDPRDTGRAPGQQTKDGQHGVDYGGHYAEAYEHTQSRDWKRFDKDGYLIPQKDI